MKFESTVQDKSRQLQIEPETGKFSIDEKAELYHFIHQDNGRRLLRIQNELYKLNDIQIEGQTVTFSLNGRWCSVNVRDERAILLDEMGFKTAAEIGEGELKAPMPGKILEIMVTEGDEVELGDPLAILEAMKMENELKAPVAGTVASVAAATGDSLEKNALILEIEADG